MNVLVKNGSPRFAAFFTVVLCTPLFVSLPAAAQFVVTDPGNTAINQGSLAGELGEYAETAARWAEEIQQWNATWKHYQQKIAQMQSLVSGTGVEFPASLLSKPLTVVDPDFGVEQKCHPSSSGLSVSSILEGLSNQIAVVNGLDIVGQQRIICSKIVIMQNLKYNEAVDLMNQTLPKMADQYMKIMTNVSTIMHDTEGNQQQKGNDIAAVDSYMEAQFDAFEQRVKQYDAYITSLQDRQRMLAQVAFKGDKGVVGTLVQTTMLAGALKVNE